MNSFILAVLLTFGEAEMVIQFPAADMADCKAGKTVFLQKYAKYGFHGWELQGIDCFKQQGV